MATLLGLGFAMAALSLACSSSSPQLAQLALSVSGEGSVVVYRHVQDAACDGGICVGGVGNAGSTSMAYEPNTDVTFVAQPSAGAQFSQWEVTVYANGRASGHTFQQSTSTDNPFVEHETGFAMDVRATFDP